MVLQAHAAARGAAGVGEARARLQRPGVARDHLQVHDAVVHGERPHLGLVEVVVGAQQPLGLPDHARRQPLAAPEQELAPDRGVARLDVQRVGGAK